MSARNTVTANHEPRTPEAARVVQATKSLIEHGIIPTGHSVIVGQLTNLIAYEMAAPEDRPDKIEADDEVTERAVRAAERIWGLYFADQTPDVHADVLDRAFAGGPT